MTFFRNNWKVLSFVPLIVIVSTMPRWGEDAFYLYNISTGIIIFLLLVWLLLSNLKAHIFTRIILLIGVVSAFVDIIECMVFNNVGNSQIPEIAFFSLIFIILIILFMRNKWSSNC